jgi:hypothetical protein
LDVQKVTHEIRLRQWIGIIKECRGSGKSVKSWCEEKGISEKSYFYRQRRMREAACRELTAYQEQQIAKAAPSNTNTRVFAVRRISDDNHADETAITTIHLNRVVVVMLVYPPDQGFFQVALAKDLVLLYTNVDGLGKQHVEEHAARVPRVPAAREFIFLSSYI